MCAEEYGLKLRNTCHFFISKKSLVIEVQFFNISVPNLFSLGEVSWSIFRNFFFRVRPATKRGNSATYPHTIRNSSSNGSFNLDGNITLDCIFNCIGFCLSGICIPNPPIAPVSLPHDDNSSDTTIQINLHHGDRLTPSLIIAVVSAVAGSFALLLTLYAYLRFRRRTLRQQRNPGSEAAADALNDNDDEIGGDLPPGGEIEHHIWYIRTQGLDDSTIASITSWIYKSSDSLIDSKDCSVFFGEFYDGELVRLLPKCSYAFHLPCIDRWLRSHVNCPLCPLCRAPIVSPATATVLAPSPASPATAVISDPADPVIGSPAQLETSQIEALPWENVSEDFEVGIVTQPSGVSSSRPSTSQLPPNSLEEEDNLQPIRRSVSMDNFSLDVIISHGSRTGEYSIASNREKPRGFLKGSLSRKLHTEMDGSLSVQSSRWFFPRVPVYKRTVPPRSTQIQNRRA
ncbi:RING-H2 finger protein ATL52-like [Phalaenopsis equestris]|uniref:RING-H2 finger protein ATL52-like n=1 Tax=Phalaenopsis equestris TaxID=78828 RepID=UPI0009E539BF|nr:RING-H2 finger protein ATL52-like [Phalaenopsis equestris]